MANQFGGKAEDWTNIAQRLIASGMNEEDVNAAGRLGEVIHTLDASTFQNPVQFVFHPSRSDHPSAGGYMEKRYFIYVEGQRKDLDAFRDELRSSWPSEVSWTVDEDLCLSSVAAEIVRLRAQEELSIDLISSKHIGKIGRIPILNRIIAANRQILAKSDAPVSPERFDAHVIGSYAAQILGENKRDHSVAGTQMLRLLVELVKLDPKIL